MTLLMLLLLVAVFLFILESLVDRNAWDDARSTQQKKPWKSHPFEGVTGRMIDTIHLFGQVYYRDLAIPFWI